MGKVRTAFTVAKRTLAGWQEDKAARLAAALAFYTVLSIPSLLVLALGIAGQFADRAAARQAILAQAEQAMGAQGQQAIETILTEVSRPTGLSLVTIVSILVLFFSASGVFVQLQEAMNKIWKVTPAGDAGIMKMVGKRITSFLMVIACGVLLLMLLVVSSLVTALRNTVTSSLGNAGVVVPATNAVVGLIIMTVVIALIYKVIPDVEIAWRDVWVGAAASAFLFILGVFGIGLYFSYSDLTSSYGAAGSLMALLLWIYYSAMILFIGAEFTQVYANRFGSHIRPAKGAVFMPGAATGEHGGAAQEQQQAAAS